MRKLVLFIATSADGFIARKNGSIDWLPQNDGNDYGYTKFIQTVDTLLFGRKTYEQMLTWGEFPHKDKKCYVFSHKPAKKKFPYVQFVSSSPVSFVRRLQKQKGSSIWLVGGAGLIYDFQQAGLIDEYVISICPVFLGAGIPIFAPTTREQHLRLTQSKTYKTGLVQLVYKKRKK